MYKKVYMYIKAQHYTHFFTVLHIKVANLMAKNINKNNKTKTKWQQIAKFKKKNLFFSKKFNFPTNYLDLF